MSNAFNLSPEMSLPVPVVGETDGPEYADYLNACFAILDGHTHSAGSGSVITPDGLNINGDLQFGGNNATLLRSARFTPQASPIALGADIGAIYVSGVDLYYNDVSGNQIRITQSGGVSGTPGSIANLTSPASATYSGGSSTFVWQSAANTPANLDAGSVIIRNVTVSSNGITLAAPNALGSNYVLTLPPSPALTTKILVMDSSGATSVSDACDNSTIELVSGQLRVKDAGLTTAKYAPLSVDTAALAASSVTTAKIAALNVTNATVADNDIIGGDKLVPNSIAWSSLPITRGGGVSLSATSFGGAATLATTTITTGRDRQIMGVFMGFLASGSGTVSFRMRLVVAGVSSTTVFASYSGATPPPGNFTFLVDTNTGSGATANYTETVIFESVSGGSDINGTFKVVSI